VYANLAVGIRCKQIDPPDKYPEEVPAWSVVIRDGVALIGLDANEDGSYAEPAGVQRIDLDKFDIAIGADF
jgi:hypothetical protein